MKKTTNRPETLQEFHPNQIPEPVKKPSNAENVPFEDVFFLPKMGDVNCHVSSLVLKVCVLRGFHHQLIPKQKKYPAAPE